ncbi:hypothetical protein BD779DRAFT_1470088 [Infundibulicybe gibba]|nr:hypothetical protein BD779DRAFT_1470088 [Infundibulicybe gibba]
MANPDRSHSKKTLTHDDLDLLATHLLNKLVVRASQSIEPKPEPEPEPGVEDQKPVGFNCTHCGGFNAFPAEEIDPEYPYTRPPSPHQNPLLIPAATFPSYLTPGRARVAGHFPTRTRLVSPRPTSPDPLVQSFEGDELTGWYTVTAGLRLGVFTNWNRMSPFVTGIRGAIHKKYKSEKAAVAAWWSAKAVGGVSLLFQ